MSKTNLLLTLFLAKIMQNFRTRLKYFFIPWVSSGVYRRAVLLYTINSVLCGIPLTLCTGALSCCCRMCQ